MPSFPSAIASSLKLQFWKLDPLQNWEKGYVYSIFIVFYLHTPSQDIRVVIVFLLFSILSSQKPGGID